MKHQKLRKETNCLNCGHQVDIRYCSHCGQENLELQDSAFHLFIHYFQDLFHYDGRMWHTLKNLIVRPGQVAVEFMAGKRKQNLEPVKLYVFASSVFFLLFFLKWDAGILFVEENDVNKLSKRLYSLNQEKKLLEGTSDTVHINSLIKSLSKQQDSIQQDTTRPRQSNVEIDLFDSPVDTTAKGWLAKYLQKRIDARTREMEQTHQGDVIKAFNAFMAELIHTLPQLFFVSLPFFALLLKLLYWRNTRRKYVEHFIFSIYLYAYLFILMTFYFLFYWGVINVKSGFVLTIISWLTTIGGIYPFVYLFLSLKRFYQDRWWKLIFRYITLLFLFIIVLMGLSLIFAVMTLLW